MGPVAAPSPNQSERTPAPIDPRGPRLNQSVLAVAMLAAFVFNIRWLVPAFGLILLAGAAFGPRYGLVLRLYAEFIRPRLKAPAYLEDPRPPRFAAAIGAVFLVAASLAFLGDLGFVAWLLVLIVTALAGLAATTGVCVGCELYLMIVKRRDLGASTT